MIPDVCCHLEECKFKWSDDDLWSLLKITWCDFTCKIIFEPPTAFPFQSQGKIMQMNVTSMLDISWINVRRLQSIVLLFIQSISTHSISLQTGHSPNLCTLRMSDSCLASVLRLETFGWALSLERGSLRHTACPYYHRILSKPNIADPWKYFYISMPP